MIKLVLLTGFLGAGKTTLLKAILDAYEDQKIGVIVNEFGKVNIDAVLLEKDGIKMAELSNGSIFCACIKDNFLNSLIEMSQMNIDYLFIEASGLADPSNMPQILKTIGPKTLNSYHYKGALCVVDAENFLDLYDMLPALEHQLEYSGAVIINKADLVGTEKIAEVSHKIEEINSGAQVYITSFCRVDIKDVITSLVSSSKEAEETTNTFESRPKTFVLSAESSLPFEDLKAFITDIAESAYRIKGFVKTDQGTIEISTVGKNISLSSWTKQIKNSEIVVISSVGIKMLSLITKGIERHLKDKIHL